jgi:broad specificity phosphatase PhoE
VIEQLLLVRHGETDHNVAGIAQGWNDSPLSTRGRDQVQRLAGRIAGHEPDAIFCSPLGRAVSTAEAIAKVTGLEITLVDDLREMSYGSWENRSFLDVRRDDADNFSRWISDPDFASPGGESHTEVRNRVDRGIRHHLGFLPRDGQELSWQLPDDMTSQPKRPIVVSHGTAIRIVATAILELPVSASRHLAQDNASLNHFLWRADRWVLKVWNDTTHCNAG